jgi:hypothetical protein
MDVTTGPPDWTGVGLGVETGGGVPPAGVAVGVGDEPRVMYVTSFEYPLSSPRASKAVAAKK